MNIFKKNIYKKNIYISKNVQVTELQRISLFKYNVNSQLQLHNCTITIFHNYGITNSKHSINELCSEGCVQLN